MWILGEAFYSRKNLGDLRFVMERWMSETGDYTPQNLTYSWYDPETGERLDIEQKRGEMPGLKTNAIKNNNKGPY